MIHVYSQTDIDNAQEKYQLIIDELNRLSGNMAGGSEQTITQNTFKSLIEKPIKFGNPMDELKRIKQTDFEESGLQLSKIATQQLQNGSFNFYFMSMTLSLKAPNGVQYYDLTMELKFNPKGANEPIIQSLFPNTEWNSVLQFGGDFRLGLDANMKWKIGVTTPEIITNAGELSAQIDNTNTMSAFVVVPDFNFDIGRTDIAATGKGNSDAWWQLSKPSLKASLSPKFGMIFKVPVNVRELTLEGKVIASPYFPWLVAQLRYVWDRLSDTMQAMLQQQTDNSLPVGDHEVWHSIILPD